MENAEKVGSREDQAIVTDDPVENLKSNAIKHDDYLGQAKWGLGTLQTSYNESQASVDVLGEVTISLDDNFMLSIKNDLDGDVLEQRVNLANLSSDLKSFEWIVDNGENPYPGVKIPVLEGQKGVENLEDGILKGTEDYLEIILADRKMVQRSLSGLMNAIRAARGEALEN
jgi:hypothetical protein